MYIYTEARPRALTKSESYLQHLSKLIVQVTSHHFKMRLTAVLISVSIALVSYVSQLLIEGYY
jgi:hypothetical protein